MAKIKTDTYTDIYHPQRQYGIIYTDPPWEQTRGGKRQARPNSSGIALDYPVMSLDEITQFHRDVLPLLAAPYHNVFMWTIDKYLIPAEMFMDKLGYIRHARIVWNKLTGMAPAYTVRFTCEYLLWFYPKNRMLKPQDNTRGKYSTCLVEAAKRHSQKPESAYCMLEDMFPTAKKNELFARLPRTGWDCWGNEVEPLDPTQEGGFPLWTRITQNSNLPRPSKTGAV